MTSPTLVRSKKAPLTIYVEQRTQQLLHDTLESERKIDMMRDYWYDMKDDAELRQFRIDEDHVIEQKYLKEIGKALHELSIEESKTLDSKKHSDEKWSDKVTTIIRSHIEAIALNGNPAIYSDIGLESRILNKGLAPIVVIFEKKKSEALNIVNEFNAGYAFSTGQFPTFEASFVATYLEECKYSMGYVFVITDHDPAGESLYDAVKKKMNTFTTETKIETIHVDFGSDAIEKFETYTLTDNKINKKWIQAGRTRGIEFNTKENIDRGILTYLKQSILDNVDARIFVDISYNQWTSRELYRSLDNDTYYTQMKDSISETEHKIEWRELRHRQRIALTPAYYLHDTPNRFKTYKETETDRNGVEDMYFYDVLLPNANPHSEVYRTSMVKEIGREQWYL